MTSRLIFALVFANLSKSRTVHIPALESGTDSARHNSCLRGRKHDRRAFSGYHAVHEPVALGGVGAEAFDAIFVLAEQIANHIGVVNGIVSQLHGAKQLSLINAEMELSPGALAPLAVLRSGPLSFAEELDPGAIGQ
jgi:hypothetical protein